MTDEQVKAQEALAKAASKAFQAIKAADAAALAAETAARKLKAAERKEHKLALELDDAVKAVTQRIEGENGWNYNDRLRATREAALKAAEALHTPAPEAV